MKIFIFILLCIIVLFLVMCYSLCVIAHEADERAEKFYKEWKEKDNGKAVQSADE